MARIKELIKQISGNTKGLKKLYPEVQIAGEGYISCYCPLDKLFIKVRRGVGGYIVEGSPDKDEKVLVYTILGKLIEVESSEVMLVGFD